jgi:hypothetical protein
LRFVEQVSRAEREAVADVVERGADAFDVELV